MFSLCWKFMFVNGSNVIAVFFFFFFFFFFSRNVKRETAMAGNYHLRLTVCLFVSLLSLSTQFYLSLFCITFLFSQHFLFLFSFVFFLNVNLYFSFFLIFFEELSRYVSLPQLLLRNFFFSFHRLFIYSQPFFFSIWFSWHPSMNFLSVCLCLWLFFLL